MVTISPADIARRYHGDLFAQFTEEEVNEQILDAQAWIDAQYPCVARRLLSGALPERAYVRVVADMVLRVLRNPDGLNNESDGTYSYGRNAAVASGNFWLTNAEKVILCGPESLVLGVATVGLDRGWGR